MPFAKKTAVFALSTALLLSAVPSAFAEDAPASAESSMPVLPTSLPAGDLPVKGGGSSDSTAAVNAKIGKDRAIELARSAVSIPEAYTLSGISFNSISYQNGRGAWNVQFEKREQNRTLGSISATIDADTGKLLNYYGYENDSDRTPTYPPKVDFTAAKSMAEALLHKMNPEDEANVRYNEEFEKQFKQPLNGSVRYQIRFDRTVNGIPFPMNYITFTIDGEGRFAEYEYKMNDDVTFGDPQGTLTAEEALKQYRAVNQPSLLYVLTHPNRDQNTAKPYLSYAMSFGMLDAKSGKLLDPAGRELTAPPSTRPITEKPLADKPAGNQNLTQEQAAAKVTAILPLPAGAELQNASYNENVDTKLAGNSGSSWNLTWRVPADKDKEASYVRASVNSQTGELLNYNKDMPYYSEKDAAAAPIAVDSLEKAQEAAIAFVKKVLPHYTSELTVDTNNLNPFPVDQLKRMRTISIPFKHLVNGIPTDFESLYVGVNVFTGGVESYWSSLSSLAMPTELGQTIDGDKAEDILLTQYTLEKRYTLPNGLPGYDPYGKMMPMPVPAGSTATKEPAKIVYVPVPKNPSEYVFLDAQTGEWRSRETGAVTSPDKVVATDLANHWAARELQLMIDYKAIDTKDGKVNPDQTIKRGEMIKMLITAMNGGYYTASYSASRKASFADVANGSEYFAYVESAVDANLIDRSSTTFNPEGSMTREEMAELLVRALGYSKLADTPGLFNLNVADAASIQHKGQVAIIVSLGIMSATDGNFLPAAEVTRAQAATAFFRYLEKRAALQDTPIRNY